MIFIFLSWLFAPLWWSIAWVRTQLTPAPQRILIIEAAGIGDVVCSTAVFRALRAGYPSARIELMVQPAVADIISCDSSLDNIIVWSPRCWRGLTGRLALARRIAGFDTMICLNPGAPQLAASCWAALPRRLTVLPGEHKRSYALLRPLMTAVSVHQNDTQFVQTQLNLLKPLGIESRDCRKSLTIHPEIAHRVSVLLPDASLVGVAIGSGLGIKEIPEPVLRNVIAHVYARPDTVVVLIGGNKEREKAARLSAGFSGRGVLDLTGRLTLAESAAVLKKLSLFIGVNTGMTHMADALNIPLICLGGPSDLKEQGPTGEQATLLQLSPSCAPCDRVFSSPRRCISGQRECITGIGSDEVIRAISNKMPGYPRKLSVPVKFISGFTLRGQAFCATAMTDPASGA
jgi:ADP-heptose:LPS heptosyltransferase